MTDIDDELDEEDDGSNEFEAEFEELEEKVRAKMEKAGKLIREAQAMVDKGVAEYGFKGSHPLDDGDVGDLDLGASELRDATRPLLNAMQEAGWSTSSMFC